MRFIIDDVLLNRRSTRVPRLRGSTWWAALFLLVVLFSNLMTLPRNYRQRLLNMRLMLSLRRSLFDRLLHLPLPKLWDMKTGGILSRLTGDVDTTTGLMQMAMHLADDLGDPPGRRDRRPAHASIGGWRSWRWPSFRAPC